MNCCAFSSSAGNSSLGSTRFHRLTESPTHPGQMMIDAYQIRQSFFVVFTIDILVLYRRLASSLLLLLVVVAAVAGAIGGGLT